MTERKTLVSKGNTLVTEGKKYFCQKNSEKNIFAKQNSETNIFEKKIFSSKVFLKKILIPNIFPKKEEGKAHLLPAGPRLISSNSEILA